MTKANRLLRITMALALTITVAQDALADEMAPSPGFWDILPETILRPVGFMSFVGGCALFAATSPLTAIASIEEPHEAMSHSFNGFVGAPIRYTFTRPIGNYAFKVYPD